MASSIARPKNCKKYKVSKVPQVTLDGKHSEMTQAFQQQHEYTIPALRHEKARIKRRLAQTTLIEERLELEDRLRDIRDQLHQLRENEQNYYLDNAKYIFEYFESKKKLAEGHGDLDAETSAVSHSNAKIQQFFRVKPTTPPPASTDQESKPIPPINFIKKYLNNVDDGTLDVHAFTYASSVCDKCSIGEWIALEDEGVLVCNNCACTSPYLVEHEKPSYKEPPKEVSFYAYRRINHFKEILTQSQAKQSTQIPPELMDRIRHQIRKERLELSEITTKKMRSILRKLGYNRYYEHMTFINDKLGIKPPVIPPALEETLCNLFMETQSPYSKYCPDSRINFLNYQYTAYKLCELLGEDRYLPLFPLLKDRDKLIEHDMIWRKICEELNWKYIPTI